MTVTWDPDNDGANLVYSNGDLTAGISVNYDWEQTLATKPMGTGKHYFEVAVVSNPQISANNVIGIQNGAEDKASYVGDTSDGWGYMSNGRYYNSGALTGKPGWATGGVVMVAVDLDNHKLWFGLNGTWDGDPAAGTGAAYSNLTAGDIYPAAAPYHSYVTCTGHFAAGDFTYAPPTGFSAWDSGGTVLTALEDISLDLAAYHEGRADLATLLEAAYLLGLEDLALALEAWAWGRTDLATALQAAKIGRHDLALALGTLAGNRQDLAMQLSTISPLVLRDLRLFLVLTDGVKRQDFAVALAALQKAPSHRTVIAQRLASIKKEAALV